MDVTRHFPHCDSYSTGHNTTAFFYITFFIRRYFSYSNQMFFLNTTRHFSCFTTYWICVIIRNQIILLLQETLVRTTHLLLWNDEKCFVTQQNNLVFVVLSFRGEKKALLQVDFPRMPSVWTLIVSVLCLYRNHFSSCGKVNRFQQRGHQWNVSVKTSVSGHVSWSHSASFCLACRLQMLSLCPDSHTVYNMFQQLSDKIHYSCTVVEYKYIKSSTVPEYSFEVLQYFQFVVLYTFTPHSQGNSSVTYIKKHHGFTKSKTLKIKPVFPNLVDLLQWEVLSLALNH